MQGCLELSPSSFLSRLFGLLMQVFSISAYAQSLHRPNKVVRNALIYLASFSVERLMLGVNDIVTAFIGHDVFFPNKVSGSESQALLWNINSFLTL